LASELTEKESEILAAFKASNEKAPFDIGGYYHPDPKKTEVAMRPVQVLNDIIAKYGGPNLGELKI